MLVLQPIIWGEWQPSFYPSGTTIVSMRDSSRKPHLYVYADWVEDEDRSDRNRMLMCHELADFMNGGKRPDWLDDMERISLVQAISLYGGSIEAVGPMVDQDPPNLFWITDPSEESADNRAKLMDAVFNKGNK